MRNRTIPAVLSLSLLMSTSNFAFAEANNGIYAPQARQTINIGGALKGFFKKLRPTSSESAGRFKSFKLLPSNKFHPTREVVGSINADKQATTIEYDFAEEAERDGLIGFEMRGMINDAINFSDSLKASKSEVKISQIQVWRELAGYAPTANLSIDATRSGLGLANTTNRRDTAELKFLLNLPLFTSGRRHFALKAAKSNRKAAMNRAQAARNELAGQVILALIQYKQAMKTVDLLGQNVSSLSRLLVAVKNRKKKGFASNADVFYVQANLASLRSQREATISDRNQLKAQLESLIQSPMNSTPKLPSLNQLIQSNEEELVAQAVISDPTLKAAQNTATAQEYASRSAVGGYLPQISLFGQHDIALNDTTRNNQTTDWQVGVRLTMPLIDLTTVTEISEAKERAQLASFQASDTRKSVELNVRSLSREFQSSKKQVGLANSRVNYLLKVAKSEAVKYDKGVGSLDNVLEQKQVLAQARIDALNTKMSAYWAAYQLLIGTGRFDGGSLGLSDKLRFSQLR